MQNSFITILIPTFNEENFISECLKSVLDFDLPENIEIEILVIDGMSTDRTVRIINENFGSVSNLKILNNPQRIQSYALNLGITSSKGDYILRLDAHTIYPSGYLKNLYETAVRTGADNTGGIIVTKEGDDSYQASMVQAVTTHKFGVGNSGFRTNAPEGPADTVPFGFFKKDVFEKIGLFNEKLVRAQDYEFNARLVKKGGKIWLNPKIYSYYYNQKSLLNFYKKQLFLEAPYNAYMWYLAPYTFNLRHSITLFFTSGLIIGALLLSLLPLLQFVYFPVIGLYFLLAILSSVQQSIRYKKPLHVLTLPLCFFLFHFLHGIGVVTGLVKILFKKAPIFK